MRRLLVLRPAPGGEATAGRAASMGFAPVVTPLFAIRPLDWSLPQNAIDAVLMTSANAARHGGEGLKAFTSLPVFVVGTASAAAARDAGFVDVHSADGDSAAAVALAEAAATTRLLHLAGRDHASVTSAIVAIETRIVYAAEPVNALPGAAREALRAGAVALLHSSRAAVFFAALTDAAGIARETVAVAAISPRAAAAAGTGWREVGIAVAPNDEALLAVAARLCDIA